MKNFILSYILDLITGSDKKITLMTKPSNNHKTGSKVIGSLLLELVKKIPENMFFTPRDAFSNINESNQYNMF